MKTTLSIILALSFLTATAQIRVSPVATGNADGTSWTNATTLENAVQTATSGQTIWVQAGTYHLSATLEIPENVRLYGGFAGSETSLSQRNFATNPTIIDANQQFAVVHLGDFAVLSGVTVQNGVANTPERMSGGGIWMGEGSRIEYSYILNNIAKHYGGGVFAEGNAEIFNAVIANNRAGLDGFAVASEDGFEILFGSNTVTGNTRFDCDGFRSEPSFDTICSGQHVTLKAVTLGTSYLWNTDAIVNTITTDPLETSKMFTVTVTMLDFCVIIDTFHITVNPTPTVTIAVSPSSTYVGQTVTFTATANPPGGTFIWNDSLATTGAVLTATMPAVGDLQFTVNYQLNGCHAEPVTATSTNTNIVPPVIGGGHLIADDSTICVGQLTQIHLIDATRNSGEWVLFSGSCGGTVVERTNIDNPTFTVSPTETTTYFLRGEIEGDTTDCIQIEITVLPLPEPITAISEEVCEGQNLVLSNATVGGGTWDAGLTGRIEIVTETDNSLTVIGIFAGEATVTFIATNGCERTFDIEVLTAPTIIGDTNFCQGEDRTFFAVPSNGTWSVFSGTSATITSAGLITASLTETGETVIQNIHSITNCPTFQTVYVHPQPETPSALSVCVGDSVALNPGNPVGGTWAIEPSHLAEFNADTAQITGLLVGTATITYQLGHCSATFELEVLSPVTSLSYIKKLCEDETSTASGFPSGGTWTSSDETIATIDEDSGEFTGVSVGTFYLTYTLANGCSRTTTAIEVLPLPTIITGPSGVGVGFTIQLESSPAEGMWTSLNPTIATVDATGLVTGISRGTTTIRYTYPMGSCFREFEITVELCATLTFRGDVAYREICLNALMTPIAYALTGATTTKIEWIDINENPIIPQPAGKSFNPLTHTISGTPTESGTFIYTITSVDHSEFCSPAVATGTLIVFDTVLPGTITSSQGTTFGVCFGEIPVEFTSAVSGSGGNPATSSYIWQYSIDGFAYSTYIPEATSLYFQAEALMLTPRVYFRRNHINACGNTSSNVITVNVHALPPTPTAEEILPNDDCDGDAPRGAITIAYITDMAYSIDGITFQASREFTNLTHGQHTMFVRDTTNGCVSFADTVITSVDGAPKLTGTMAVTPYATICFPFPGEYIVITPTFTDLGTDPLPTFQWAIIIGADTVNIDGATSQNLRLDSIDPKFPRETTTFRIIATNTETNCRANFYKTITVVTPQQIVHQPVGGSICVGQTAMNLFVTATSVTGHSYQWQRSSDSVSFDNITGATASAYTVPNTYVSAYWYRVQIIKYNNICPSIWSNAVRVNVLEMPEITAVRLDTICGAGTANLSATANPATATIRWFSYQTGGTALGTSASGIAWTTPTITATTTYWVEAYNNVCYSVPRRYAIAMVVPPHVIHSIPVGATNQTVCQGATITTINFGFSGGATGGTIEWSGPGGTISAPQGLIATATTISGVVALSATPGIYTFTITTTPAGGVCSPVTYSGTITVNPVPTAVTVTSEPRCGSAILTASGGVGGTIFWQNITSNGTSTASSSLSQTVTANNTYYFRARTDLGCWGMQGAYTVIISQPHMLTLTSATATANQTVGRNQAITPIVYARGGSATEVTITWTGTASPSTPPAGITVSSLTATPITISGTPMAFGVYGFTLTTVENICPPISLSGTITVTNLIPGCNNATPGWGSGGLGVISWGTLGNTDIESEARTIPGTGSRPTQVWSGAVFASVCTNKATLSGGSTGSFNADCRRANTNLTGHLFTWCAVMRFEDQLCPAPWRVPTIGDFQILHQNLGHSGLLVVDQPVSVIANTYMGTTGTHSAPQIGGAWGGARFTGYAPNAIASDNTRYWSATAPGTASASHLHLMWTQVALRGVTGRGSGFALRCVR